MPGMPSEHASDALRALVAWRCTMSGGWTEHWHEQADLDVVYRDGVVTIEVEQTPRLHQRIGAPGDGFWSDEETTVYLFEVHRAAVVARTFDDLVLPSLFAARRHPMFTKGLVPRHTVGMRCTREPSGLPAARNSNERRRRRRAGLHDHEARCFVEVAAMDVAAWIAAHPAEHRRFVELCPLEWARYLREQRTTVNESNERG